MDKKPSLFRRPLSRRFFLKGALGIFGVAALGAGKGYSNTLSSQIRVERVPIKLERLPGSFRGLKIALLSDMHSSPLVSKEHLKESVRLAMVEKPDLVVLTGDFVGHTLKTSMDQIHDFDPIYLENLVEVLRPIKAPLGKFAVLGNHDFWSGAEALNWICHDFENLAGVPVLRNQSVTLKRGGDSIQLVGIDDYWNSWDLTKALSNVPDETVRILLSHNPDINRSIKPSQKIDLVLSGHTHGGQIAFPVLGAPFSPTQDKRYLKGLVRDGDRQTYITRGVGHLLVPIRFNCPPEVSLITLI